MRIFVNNDYVFGVTTCFFKDIVKDSAYLKPFKGIFKYTFKIQCSDCLVPLISLQYFWRNLCYLLNCCVIPLNPVYMGDTKSDALHHDFAAHVGPTAGAISERHWLPVRCN